MTNRPYSGMAATYEEVGAKTCRTCDLRKPRREFYAKADAADGLDPYCKACRRRVSARSTRARAEAQRRLIANHRDEWSELLATVHAEHDAEETA